MASEKIRLEIIKRLEQVKGKKLKIKVHKGRKKYICFYGYIKDICPYVFTIIEDKENPQLQSYSFSDLLTKDIVLSII